jgi:hypothetical protein
VTQDGDAYLDELCHKFPATLCKFRCGIWSSVDVLVELCTQQVVYEPATFCLPGTHRLILEYQVLMEVSSNVTGQEGQYN